MKASIYSFAYAAVLTCAVAAHSFAQEVSVTGTASFGESEPVYAVQTWTKYRWFNVFAATDFAEKWSASGMVTVGPAAAGGGILQKPGVLSRLNRPETTAYASALSTPTLTSVGHLAEVSHTLPATPVWAGTAQFTVPTTKGAKIKGSTVEVYANNKGTVGADAVVPLNLGETAVRLGTGVFSYPLTQKKVQSWYVDTPQFAPGSYLSALFEASVRYRSGKVRKYRNWWQPVVVTAYGGAGAAETPFGGFNLWFKGDLGVSAGLVSVKGKFYTAPYEFFTPDGRYAPHRSQFAFSPTVNIRLLPSRGILLATGGSVFTDTSTELYKIRGALKVSNGQGAVTINGALDDWYMNGGSLEASKQSSVPIGITVQTILNAAKVSVTGKRKWYCNENREEKKTEWSAGLTATPRLKGARWTQAVPAVSGSFTNTVYPDGREKVTGKVGLKWAGKVKTVKWAGKVEMLL